MNTIVATLAALVCVLYLNGGSCYICHLDDLYQCTEPLEAFMPAQAFNNHHYRIYKQTTEGIEHFCRVYETEVYACVTDVTQRCKAYAEGIYKGLKQSAEYICNDGFQGLLKYKDCLASDTTDSNIESCLTKFKRVYMFAGHYTKESCGSIAAVSECFVNATELGCGKDAAEWMKAWNEATFHQIKKDIGCGKKPLSAKTLVGIIVGSIVGTAVFFVCAVCVCSAITKCRKKAKSHLGTSTQTNSAVGPAAILSEELESTPSYNETDIELSSKHI